MSFARMRNAASHLLPKAYEHPFNKELVKGTLPRNIFRFYLEQDFLYLRDFSKALRTTSHRLRINKHAQEFRKFSDEVTETQRNLHYKYLGESQSFQLFQSREISVKKIHALSNYTEHLLKAAHTSPIEEAVASLIPCFWLYNDLGRKMLTAPDYNINNPYHLWILSYSNEQFTSSTKSIIQIAEELGDSILCPVKQKNMTSAFVKSTKYELLFWDSVYKKLDKSNELLTQHQFRA